jgi:hypothetical protein
MNPEPGIANGFPPVPTPPPPPRERHPLSVGGQGSAEHLALQPPKGRADPIRGC